MSDTLDIHSDVFSNIIPQHHILRIVTSLDEDAVSHADSPGIRSVQVRVPDYLTKFESGGGACLGGYLQNRVSLLSFSIK